MTRHSRFWEWFQIGVLAAMFAVAALRWSSVPERIPVHWNAAGQVDGYGGRFEGLLLMPLIAVGLYLLLRYIPRIDPARRNYASFADTYLLIRVALMVYLAFVFVVTQLAIGHEASVPVGGLVIGAIGVLLMVLGAVMGRLRPNWFAGIRTPWTLSSTRSWERTHRVGGWVFVGIGAVTMGTAPVGSELAIIVMMVAMLVGVVGLSAYSYVVWRDDPDKVPLADLKNRKD